jgi:hypothetical protein
MPFSDIPNGSHLNLRTPHPEHDLWDGMLLEPASFVHGCTENNVVNICSCCLLELEKPDSHLPPHLSLANNMWLGQVLWQLQI